MQVEELMVSEYTSIYEVSKMLGIDWETADKYVKLIKERWKLENKRPFDKVKMRKNAIRRARNIRRRLVKDLLSGDLSSSAKASIAQAISKYDQREADLIGLDAPKEEKHDVTLNKAQKFINEISDYEAVHDKPKADGGEAKDDTAPKPTEAYKSNK